MPPGGSVSEHAVEKYLRRMSQFHATGAGTDETAYYSPLQSLLDAAGGGLRPRVICLMGMKNQGAGHPDSGLFTSSQFQSGGGPLKKGQIPSRGVIECKPLREQVLEIADTKQVSKYWDRYNQVLVTNYREFLLIGREGDEPIRHEHFKLAETEADFWELASDPKGTADRVGGTFLDFLKRVIRRPAQLTQPKDLAWFLASYARDARTRIESAPDQPALKAIQKSLQDALGLELRNEDGDHFFRSTLIQTLFYGVFAAWVLWHRSTANRADDQFVWEKAPRYLHVPILRKLFRDLTDPLQLDEVNLTEVMEWAVQTLNRVNRKEFFSKFKDAESVQYFYEPFLEAFDPELRKKLGVWYTPPEIVEYMVKRVDQVLREQFGRPDGLADENVFVLDPCCGTGAYLVETLRTISATLTDQGEDFLLASRLKKAATERLFGFEILPAPFVVAHLQLGLFLQSQGAPLVESKKERAGVYLTNALTGWTTPTGPKQSLMFPEMEEERDAAEKVKQGVPILVVMGNPPYYSKAQKPFDASEEVGLIQPYRKTINAKKPEGGGLNDLYVRFFRIAERCITEKGNHHGLVCFISNYSWLDGQSHTGMRERFLAEFDHIWIDALNGDRDRTGKRTPDNKPDPSVFSTKSNREGIKEGVAVATLARIPAHASPGIVHFTDFWGTKKREELVDHGEAVDAGRYEEVHPYGDMLVFRPGKSNLNYRAWPLLSELFPAFSPGVKTSRDIDLVEVDKAVLEKRMRMYFDPAVPDDSVKMRTKGLMKSSTGFDAPAVRSQLQKEGIDAGQFVPYSYQPFDNRWVYWTATTKLIDRNREELFRMIRPGNLFLTSRKTGERDKEGSPFYVTKYLPDWHLTRPGCLCFPLKKVAKGGTKSMFDAESPEDSNHSELTGHYLESLGVANVADTDLVFMHAVAIGHSPLYLAENAAGIRQSFPRVPLPASLDALQRSAELGRKIVALLDSDASISGITVGKATPLMRLIAMPAKADGGQLSDADFDLTAGWGSLQQNGTTMPGQGLLDTRAFTDEESATLGDDGLAILGTMTYDVHLSKDVIWRNVPLPLWEYRVGGYQTLKKWLSYREHEVLKRALNAEEVAHFRNMARRIATLLLMGPTLDKNYQNCGADIYSAGPVTADNATEQ